MYKRHWALVVGIQKDGVFPEFGKVEDIFVVDNELYFHVQLCLTMKYSKHYHADVFVTKKEYLNYYYSYSTVVTHTTTYSFYCWFDKTW